MSALRSTITALAENFTAQVLRALQTASLSDLAALSGGGASAARRGPGRPPKAEAAAAAPAAPRGRRGGRRRRTAADLAALGSRITDALKGKSDGMRAEALRAELGVPRKELPRVIQQLLDAGTIRKEGQKRATTYYVGEGSGGGGGGAKKAAKKGRRARK